MTEEFDIGGFSVKLSLSGNRENTAILFSTGPLAHRQFIIDEIAIKLMEEGISRENLHISGDGITINNSKGTLKEIRATLNDMASLYETPSEIEAAAAERSRFENLRGTAEGLKLKRGLGQWMKENHAALARQFEDKERFFKSVTSQTIPENLREMMQVAIAYSSYIARDPVKGALARKRMEWEQNLSQEQALEIQRRFKKSLDTKPIVLDDIIADLTPSGFAPEPTDSFEEKIKNGRAMAFYHRFTQIMGQYFDELFPQEKKPPGTGVGL